MQGVQLTRDLLGDAGHLPQSGLNAVGGLGQYGAGLTVDLLGPLPGHALCALGPAIGFQLPVGLQLFTAGPEQGLLPVLPGGCQLLLRRFPLRQSLVPFLPGGFQLLLQLPAPGLQGRALGVFCRGFRLPPQGLQVGIQLIHLGCVAVVQVFQIVCHILPVEPMQGGTEVQIHNISPQF